MADRPDPGSPRDGDERLARLVCELCDLPGPTGYEDAVRARLLELWQPHVSELRTDAVGNVLARVGDGSGRRVLVDAHMDEISFRVASITDDGFLRLADALPRGQDQPQERRYMVAQPAQVISRAGVVARGVFAAPSGHVLTKEMRDRGHLMASDFFLELGLETRAAAEALGVHAGAPVIFDVATRRLGTRLVGKALDDRLLLAIMTRLLEVLDPDTLTLDLWLAATVQEENGVHGARALAATERFDAVIALDVGLTSDVPGLSAELPTRLGGGPVIVHSDDYVHYDVPLTWSLVDAAAGAGITCQHAAFGRYGSDGLAYLDAGMPAALVATPVRYTHTAIETAELSDATATLELIRAFATA